MKRTTFLATAIPMIKRINLTAMKHQKVKNLAIVFTLPIVILIFTTGYLISNITNPVISPTMPDPICNKVVHNIND
jgi:hypothetical protein